MSVCTSVEFTHFLLEMLLNPPPDIAVGAPYEGRGRVYIYHGSAKGIDVRPAQVSRYTPSYAKPNGSKKSTSKKHLYKSMH